MKTVGESNPTKPRSATTNAWRSYRMKFRTLIASLAILTLVSGVAYAASRFSATASEFDPGNTFLVQAQWLDGIGCPTNGRIAIANADFTGAATTAPDSGLGGPAGG